jgi:hypothetical protein
MFKTNLTHSQAVILAEKLTQEYSEDIWPNSFTAHDSTIVPKEEPASQEDIRIIIRWFEFGIKAMEPTLDKIQGYAEQITAKINQT